MSIVVLAITTYIAVACTVALNWVPILEFINVKQYIKNTLLNSVFITMIIMSIYFSTLATIY